MDKEKVYFYRNKSEESGTAKKILDNANIQHEEIFSNSDRVLPCLIVEKSAIVFDGEDGVRLYASFFE